MANEVLKETFLNLRDFVVVPFGPCAIFLQFINVINVHGNNETCLPIHKEGQFWVPSAGGTHLRILLLDA